jgi:hypothetical protein
MDEDRFRTAERRTSDRVPLGAAVSMRLEAQSIAGFGDDVSPAGILFLTNEPLRVFVRYADDDGEHEREGRLVRVQRMNDAGSGFAVAFD